MTPPNSEPATRTLPYGAVAIAQAAALIRAGGCVAVPTETVYGLAADATDSRAVAGIYAAKGRPSFNPLIVHVPDVAAAGRIAILDAAAVRLASSFWPGPLTLVLPLRPGAPISSLVTAGLDTVAVRVPAHRAMQALLAASARPLAAPSANASGAISPTRADHVVRSLEGRIPLVLDDGPTLRGVESTIVACLADGVRLLREGPIAREALARVTALDDAEPGRILAPGQLLSHYAPGKPLRIDADAWRPGEWRIGFGALDGDANLSPSADVTEAAARLFALLHEGDASGHARIAIARVPADGIGAAINDRLRRAAHE